MATRDLPTPQALRQLLRYEPDTGKLFWMPRADGRSQWNGRYAGTEAGTSAGKNGYLQIGISGVTILKHRAIWALVHGAWPEAEIDHVNMDRADNRLSNLRKATRSQNQCNRTVRKDSKAGFKGVRLHTRSGLWQARIWTGQREESLGYFTTDKEAHAAYCVASAQRHGAFSRTG